MKKILFVGPMTPPIHGQSIAFEEIYTKTKFTKYLINQNFENMSLLKKILATSWSLTKLTYVLIVHKVDIVYFTCSRSKFGSLKDIYLLKISKLFNKKIINHLHGTAMDEFYNSLSPIHQKLLYSSYNKIDCSIVLLPSMIEQFTHLWPNMRVDVVANFYDDSLNTIHEKKENDIIQLLYLSNIIASKGIFDLLDALKIIEKKGIEYKLSIAGNFIADENTSSLKIKEMFMEEISDNKHIEYLGTVFGEDKKILLEKSDIFILPTYHKTEAFPISILEAMRAGNVIITTQHNYLPEIVFTENGSLVPIKNSKAIADEIFKYTENSFLKKEIQYFNMKYAENNFSATAYIEKLNNLFNQI